jgi:phenylacetate-coenzyme A ligase PaaK-like adenylate-forming protein
MIDHLRVLDQMFLAGPYSLAHPDKLRLLHSGIASLTQYHLKNNPSYKNIVCSQDYDHEKVKNLSSFPSIPVRLFKEIELVTNPKNLVTRSLNSSGTSGQLTSKIYIDAETSSIQTKALIKIISHYVGKQRLPMLVIDAPSTIKNRSVFTARAAGILGFSKFSTSITYALNDDMSPNWDAILKFADINGSDPVLIFGFTSIVWFHLIHSLNSSNINLQLNGAFFFHGGGWKKITEEDQVTKEHFKSTINRVFGSTKVYDYYGMAEQTGSILVECEYGYMHTSIYSEILIRDQLTHEVNDLNETGLVETISILPRSYPGHVLLTEDLGRQIGVDDCKCGKLGSYFLIEGRIKRAEIRGCSDTYQID